MKRIQRSVKQNIVKTIPKKLIEYPKIIINKSVVTTHHEIATDIPNKEVDYPVINIITRTSGRPLGFKRCSDSIKKQTYKNIRHIVSIDNIDDKIYLEQEGVDYLFIDKNQIINKPDIPDPKTGKRFIYNLYFNILINVVKEGWVLILDDDDYLTNDTVIQTMVDNIKNTTDMLIFQMKYPNNVVLPSNNEMNQKPKIGRIGSPCILIHSSIAKKISWDGWKCADYRYISKAWDLTYDKKWLTMPLISLGGAGFGLKKDISIQEKNVIIQKTTTDNSKGLLTAFNKKFNNLSNDIKTQSHNLDLNKEEASLIVLSVGWNCAKYINELYNSLINQKYSNWLWYVLDDASTDNSLKILEEIALKDERVKLYSNSVNLGAAYNRLYLINEINNPEAIILLVDTDDMLPPNTFNYISNYYHKHSNVKITFGSYRNIKGKEFKKHFYNKSYFDSKKIPLNEEFKLPPLRTFRRNICNLKYNDMKDSNNNFYRYCTDVILLLQLLKNLKSNNIGYIDDIMYIYRNDRIDNTISKNKNKDAIKKEIIRKIYG